MSGDPRDAVHHDREATNIFSGERISRPWEAVIIGQLGFVFCKDIIYVRVLCSIRDNPNEDKPFGKNTPRKRIRIRTRKKKSECSLDVSSVQKPPEDVRLTG